VSGEVVPSSVELRWRPGEHQAALTSESVRRWVILAQIDGGQRPSSTGEELAEIKPLKAETGVCVKTWPS